MDILDQAVQAYGPRAYAVAALLDKKRWTLETLAPGPQHIISIENIECLFKEAFDTLKQKRNKENANLDAKSVAQLGQVTGTSGLHGHEGGPCDAEVDSRHRCNSSSRSAIGPQARGKRSFASLQDS